jgi:hypothetical protein
VPRYNNDNNNNNNNVAHLTRKYHQYNPLSLSLLFGVDALCNMPRMSSQKRWVGIALHSQRLPCSPTSCAQRHANVPKLGEHAGVESAPEVVKRRQASDTLCTSCTYLEDHAVALEAGSVAVYGYPWSPEHKRWSGLSAFQACALDAPKRWQKVIRQRERI